MDGGDWIALVANIPGFIALGWRVWDAWQDRKPLDVQAFMESTPYGYITNTSARPVHVIRACFAETKDRQIYWIGSDYLSRLLPPFQQMPVSISWTGDKLFEGHLWVEDALGRAYKAKVSRPTPPTVF